MSLKRLLPILFSTSLIIVVAMTGDLWAQSGCSKCMSPPNGLFSRKQPSPVPVMTNRIRFDRPRVEDTPPLASPLLIPTESDQPLVAPVDAAQSNKTSPTPKPAIDKLSISDKINLRYSDPRVLRMMAQLTPEAAESLYVEVSDLIDSRHIAPATSAQRVDRSLDHLNQALESPAFLKAAHVKSTSEEMAVFKDYLQRLRTKARAQNTKDSLGVLRSVQLMAAQTVEIDPTAIGLEFVYGATDSLDQFSMLLPPERTGGPRVGLKEELVGIGVEVEQHPQGLKILKLMPDGPAAQADLRPDDIITQADGTELKQMDFNRSVDLISGAEGTSLEIQASRAGRLGRVTLIRKRIPVHSVVDVRMEDPARKIAYLKLEQFSDSTVSELDAALLTLHRQGMQALIMDLRGNPGGLLTTAIAVSDRFLPSGTIVSTRGRTRSDNTIEKAHFGKTWKTPLVVLIDHNSASASEIFAAAIQENHRGLIVGEKSYGKGTVQTLFPLQTFPAALRLTTAKFYSPQGHEMAGVGVTPDVELSANANSTGMSDPALNEALRQVSDPRVKDMAENYRRTGEVLDESHVAA